MSSWQTSHTGDVNVWIGTIHIDLSNALMNACEYALFYMRYLIQISILYYQGAIEPGQQTHVRTPCAYSQDTVTANYQLIHAIQRAPLGRAFIIPRSILR